ncbi:uncharacterized protein RJT20DRAFT_125095 [Scheffersomyces xylosifermentans]|uniref:uncharacterized protein n=1 Tax=Scheffersomyces xylosifermentans TaxID=1304137 RepID=UPI00315D2F19
MVEEQAQTSQAKPQAPAQVSDSQKAEKAPAAAADGASKGSDDKKLSNKEMKELKKKEKAAKRAAQKEAIGISPEQQAKNAESKIEKKKSSATNTNLKKQLDQTLIKDQGGKRIPAIFSHLETREQRNASSPSISHIVHPAILSLTLKYSTYKIVGSTPRLKNMLEVFKVVIRDYETPANTTLTRHLTGHLSHQIEYLKTGRPLSISMGNAIRWLKQEISHISIDTKEQQAKETLCEKIDDFIKEKIELSGQVIIENASKHITDGSTILTYGHSEVLEKLFKYCVIEQNKKFNLIVVDSRPLFEGKRLLTNLVNTNYNPDGEGLDSEVESIASSRSIKSQPITHENLKIHYVLINSLSSTILEDVDCVFLGAHAMLSNGRLYSRVGTGLIAMMCHARNIPVLTCCESVKFSDKVQLDSVTTNELADCDDLVQDINSKKPPQKKSFALEQFIKQCEEEKESKNKNNNKGKQQQQKKSSPEPDAQADDSTPLKDWKNISHLNILNIMYDLTPPEYIKKVVTELGALPPSAVPVILREYKNT